MSARTRPRLPRRATRLALPYAWTSEWHPGGHGLHVHFAVGRYVRQRVIRDVWGRGIVHIKLIGDLPQGSGALEEARVAAARTERAAPVRAARPRQARLHPVAA